MFALIACVAPSTESSTPVQDSLDLETGTISIMNFHAN